MGTKVPNTDRERLAFRIFLEFEEVIRVGEDDTELIRIWGHASIVEGRNGFTRLVTALALDVSGDAAIADRFLEARNFL
jgi:hypothetical protein